jgi:hypothetical protein
MMTPMRIRVHVRGRSLVLVAAANPRFIRILRSCGQAALTVVLGVVAILVASSITRQ